MLGVVLTRETGLVDIWATARPRDDRWKEDLDRTTIGTVYEDLSGTELLRDPPAALGRPFTFCGLPFDRQTVDYLEATRAREDPDPYGMHLQARLRDDKWKQVLDVNTVEAVFDDLEDSELAFLLED